MQNHTVTFRNTSYKIQIYEVVPISKVEHTREVFNL